MGVMKDYDRRIRQGGDDAIAAACELMPRWIPVSERLPDHHGTVVCRTQDRQLQFGRVMTVSEYGGGHVIETHHWRGYPDCPLAVTHWFPLPEPPASF